MCRSVYRTKLSERLAERNAPETSSRTALIGYCVKLDTRTTPVGNQPLTATGRGVCIRAEVALYERGLECDFAVLAGRCPGAATGGRCQRYLSSRRPAVAGLAVCRWLVRRLAEHGISPTRGCRGSAVA